MKSFLILTQIFTLAVVAVAKPLVLRIDSKCETCTPTNRDRLAAALRNNLQELDVREAEPGQKAPTLLVFAIEEDSGWTLSEVVNSPKGTLVSVTRTYYGGGFQEIVDSGADSAVAHAKKTVEEAIQRAKDATEKAKKKP